MNKDNTILLFCGAIALILVMLITTVVNIAKISKNFRKTNVEQNISTNIIDENDDY